MSVGLLLVTHNRIGEELLKTATATLNGCPLAVRTLQIGTVQDPERLLAQARDLVAQLDSGDGVLVLTDMYGSTPSNVATRLLDSEPVTVVAGVSLPMLIRVLNYARLGLAPLVDKAISGGYEGIVVSKRAGERAG